MRRLCSGTIVMLASLLMVACGDEGDTTVIERSPQGQQQQPRTVTEEQVQTVTEEAPPPEEEAASGAIPDVVGERLDVAKREVKAAGYSTRTVGGGVFGVVLPENWVVCDQEPTGPAPAGTKVDLTVDRSC